MRLAIFRERILSHQPLSNFLSLLPHSFAFLSLAPVRIIRNECSLHLKRHRIRGWVFAARGESSSTIIPTKFLMRFIHVALLDILELSARKRVCSTVKSLSESPGTRVRVVGARGECSSRRSSPLWPYLSFNLDLTFSNS